MITPTHCIMYISKNRFDEKETCGRCLDHPLEVGYEACLSVIGKGYCFKNRTTPVLP